MQQSSIRVAIVAPVHNRKELTLQCLKSLERLEKGRLDIHTIIVDDGSTDGTSEAIEAGFPHVEIIKGDGNLWFTEGTNIGIRAALERDPDYVLMINDDQVFDSRSLEFMVETAEKYNRAVVGPLLLLWDAPHKLFQTSPVWKTWAGGWQHWSHQTVWTIPDRAWKVDLIVGNCVLVPAAAIKECGLLDAKHFPNFGDAEYTPRLRRAGWDLLIDPRSRVFCQPNYIPARVRDKSFGTMFYDLFIDLKFGHSLRRRFYACVKGGPSKLQGIAAFFSFLFLAATDRSAESQKLSEGRSEPPLKDTFSAAVIND